MHLEMTLRFLLIQQQWTITELARHSKVAAPVILKMLSGEFHDPRFSTLQKLAGAFGLTISQLVGEDPLPK